MWKNFILTLNLTQQLSNITPPKFRCAGLKLGISLFPKNHSCKFIENSKLCPKRSKSGWNVRGEKVRL